MKLEDLMPEYQVRSAHQILVNASAEKIQAALFTTDFSDSAVIRWLMKIRRFGQSYKTEGPVLDRLSQAGFMKVAEVEGREIVIGVVGKFWRPDSGIAHIAPAQFANFSTPGFAKAVWNFCIVPVSESSCLLTTQTRVRAFGKSAQLKFRIYWFFVGPFSGLIRHAMLRLIKRRAEAMPAVNIAV